MKCASLPDAVNVWCYVALKTESQVYRICVEKEMLTMEQIEAAMYQKMKKSDRLNEEKMEGFTMEGGQKEQILQWFVETQAMFILSDGNFPRWFQGFISRQ